MFNWDQREQFVPEASQGGWGAPNTPLPAQSSGWDNRTPVLRNRTQDDYNPGVIRQTEPGEPAWFRETINPLYNQMFAEKLARKEPVDWSRLQVPVERGMDFVDPSGVGMHGAGGLVKWMGKNYDNMYFIRGMREPEKEFSALSHVINNADKIKIPHDQSVVVGTPGFTPHVATSGVLYHGDMDKDVKALALGDMYSVYRDKGPMIGGDYDKAGRALIYRKELEEARPYMDILSMIGETPGSYESARARLRSATKAPENMREELEDHVLQMTNNARDNFEDFFKYAGGGGMEPRNPAGRNINYGPIEGPFTTIQSDTSRIDRALENIGRIEQQAGKQRAKELSYIPADKQHLLRDPKQVSAEDFFSQQADRFNEFVKTGHVKPSSFYNEAVHTLNKNVGDRLAGVFVDIDNPDEVALAFARQHGLPIFALPKGAEDTAEQTGKQFWAEMFNKGVNRTGLVDNEKVDARAFDIIQEVFGRGSGIGAREARQQAMSDLYGAPEVKGEWVKAPRQSIGAGKVIRENQDAIMNYAREAGLFTPDEAAGVTGQGGMKDLLRWVAYYGLSDEATHRGLSKEIVDALNRSVRPYDLAAPEGYGPVTNYYKSSLMPTNRKLHYTGRDFPFE